MKLVDLYGDFWNRPENIEQAMRAKQTFEMADGEQPNHIGWYGKCKCKNCGRMSIDHNHFNECPE